MQYTNEQEELVNNEPNREEIITENQNMAFGDF